MKSQLKVTAQSDLLKELIRVVDNKLLKCFQCSILHSKAARSAVNKLKRNMELVKDMMNEIVRNNWIDINLIYCELLHQVKEQLTTLSWYREDIELLMRRLIFYNSEWQSRRIIEIEEGGEKISYTFVKIRQQQQSQNIINQQLNQDFPLHLLELKDLDLQRVIQHLDNRIEFEGFDKVNGKEVNVNYFQDKEEMEEFCKVQLELLKDLSLQSGIRMIHNKYEFSNKKNKGWIVTKEMIITLQNYQQVQTTKPIKVTFKEMMVEIILALKQIHNKGWYVKNICPKSIIFSLKDKRWKLDFLQHSQQFIKQNEIQATQNEGNDNHKDKEDNSEIFTCEGVIGYMDEQMKRCFREGWSIANYDFKKQDLYALGTVFEEYLEYYGIKNEGYQQLINSLKSGEYGNLEFEKEILSFKLNLIPPLINIQKSVIDYIQMARALLLLGEIQYSLEHLLLAEEEIEVHWNEYQPNIIMELVLYYEECLHCQVKITDWVVEYLEMNEAFSLVSNQQVKIHQQSETQKQTILPNKISLKTCYHYLIEAKQKLEQNQYQQAMQKAKQATEAIEFYIETPYKNLFVEELSNGYMVYGKAAYLNNNFMESELVILKAINILRNKITEESPIILSSSFMTFSEKIQTQILLSKVYYLQAKNYEGIKNYEKCLIALGYCLSFGYYEERQKYNSQVQILFNIGQSFQKLGLKNKQEEFDQKATKIIKEKNLSNLLIESNQKSIQFQDFLSKLAK